MRILTVGTVATATGISPDAVRYYEKLKLIAPAERTPSGYRVFDSSQIGRIRVIKQAQALGLTLDEIKDLFPVGSVTHAKCKRVRSTLQGKIAMTDARILELRRFRTELSAYLHRCDAAIEAGGDSCPIFEPKAAMDRRQRRRTR